MKYVALIRGIMPSNPNMSNANLCRVIEGLVYKNVRAIISSGNVIFSSDESDTSEMQEKITTALQTELGIPGLTIVRSQTSLEKLLATKPFGNQAHSNETYQAVTFLRTKSAGAKVLNLKELELKFESENTICFVSNNTVTTGPNIMSALEKAYGKDITTRTYKTVERIVTKLREIE